MIAGYLSPALDFLRLGGPVVALIGVLSVLMLAIAAMKLWQFFVRRVGFHGRAAEALASWRAGRPREALALAESGRGAVAEALAHAMRLRLHGSGDREQIADSLRLLASARLHDLQKGFRALDAIAQIAPLLGLFGTVLGMIEAFRKLQDAGSAVDPSLLAGGIWVALLTTAAGLAVAMPASLILTFLETRLDDERAAIETMAGAVVDETPGAPAEASGTALPSHGLAHAY